MPTMGSKCAYPSWKTEYDPILNQVYYVNSEDGSVSFDSPCEVHQASKRYSSPGFFTRISSKFSLSRSKSSNNANACSLLKFVSRRTSDTVRPTRSGPEADFQSKSLSNVQSLERLKSDLYSLASDPRNRYLVERPFNLDRDDDMISISTDASIKSFYQELPRTDFHFDHNCASYAMPRVDFEKEKERYEFHEQILQELY